MEDPVKRQSNWLSPATRPRSLLGTEIFNGTINAMVDGTFQAFANSKPEEAEVREQTYHHYRALSISSAPYNSGCRSKTRSRRNTPRQIVTTTQRVNEHHARQMQQTNTSMAEPKQLDIEDAILARWEDADEDQPSEDEDAVATSDQDEEALDPGDDFDEDQQVETEDELDDDTDRDDEETADDPEEDDAEEDEEDEDEIQLVSDDAEVEVTVDGETQRVSVASLKRLAGHGAGPYEKKPRNCSPA